MILKLKKVLKGAIIAAFAIALFTVSCSKEQEESNDFGAGQEDGRENAPFKAKLVFNDEGQDETEIGDAKMKEALLLALEELAESERSTGFKPGDGFKESALREKAGDYSGAVLAAFKELLWAYSYNSDNSMTQGTMKEALENIKKLYKGEKAENDDKYEKKSEKQQKAALLAVDAALSWLNKDWVRSSELLSEIPNDEVDGFQNWLELVALLERDSSSSKLRASYSALRARYEFFPAYWNYGARNMPSKLSGEYAERCINLVPEGVYADEARKILAKFAGLGEKEGPSIRSKYEIESAITASTQQNDPSLLSPLLPLISLNDNPYTLYAAGALRALSANAQFKDWFLAQEKSAKGSEFGVRLKDRLRYIARG